MNLIIEKKKIGIVGLGPVGMILAVKFAEAGCDVSLCIRSQSKIDRIIKEGLFLENLQQSTSKFDKIYSSVEGMAELDLDYLIFALKSYQTKEAVQQSQILNNDKITFVSAQNGIDTENILTSEFGEAKVLRMVVNFAGNLVTANCTKVTFFTPPNYIGSVNDARNSKANEIAQLLTSVGMETVALNSFELVKKTWEKTILNSSLSALCGVGRLTMAEAMDDPDTLELIEQIITEGIEVAGAEKIHFPDDFRRYCIKYLKKGGDHFPSLAVDLLNKRNTEIDYFNGKIVEYGRKHYIRTSLNLSFTNMVKAMTNKNVDSRIPGPIGLQNKKIIEKGLVYDRNNSRNHRKDDYFLGVDLGSAFSKFTVIDTDRKPIFRFFVPSLGNEKNAFKNVLQSIHSEFNIKHTCATGYGRKHFQESDSTKTEINCAAAGINQYYPGEKNIIDIGGEDIKVIRCNTEGDVENFYMNDKCAAGTGSFLSEIANRSSISISDMSELASSSSYEKELNSFCTVFAKTEITNWIFDGLETKDIAKGIYNSIVSKVSKMRLQDDIPTYMIGGVIGHHPFLSVILSEKTGKEIIVVDSPQYLTSYGAAILGREQWMMETTPLITSTKLII